jgi:Amt family ammonium transporter
MMGTTIVAQMPQQQGTEACVSVKAESRLFYFLRRKFMRKIFLLGLLSFALAAGFASVVRADDATNNATIAASPAAPAPAATSAVAAVPAVAAAPAAKVDTGDTAWMLISSALVLLMTLPGLAFFYGGLVRRKNILGVLMQCGIILCVPGVFTRQCFCRFA